MMKTKWILSVLGVTLIASEAPILAQKDSAKSARIAKPAGAAKSSGGNNRNRMMATLGLTAVQKAKEAKLRKERQDKMDAVNADKKLTDKQRSEKRSKIRKAYRKGFTAILTPTQKAKFAELRKKNDAQDVAAKAAAMKGGAKKAKG
jgi:hypothetical protein